MKTLRLNCIELILSPQGSVQLFNPPLSTDLEVIPNNAIESFDQTVRVGFGTTTTESGLEPGMTISQRLTGLLVSLLVMVVQVLPDDS